MVYQWHEVLADFKTQNGGETKILMTEAYTDINTLMQYYGNGIRNGSQIPFNFELLTNTNINSKAIDVNKQIELFLSKIPKTVHANWVVRLNKIGNPASINYQHYNFS